MQVHRPEKQHPSFEPMERPQREIDVSQDLRRLAWVLDDLITIPGTGLRFGLDALVGLIPGVGDTATSLASFYILVAGVRYRVPKVTLLRMALNLAIDYAVGSLPLVGDLFDAWWKSNQRNVALLSQRATVSSSEARQGKISDWLFVSGIILFLIGIVAGAALVSVFLMMLIANQFLGTPGN